MIGLFLLTFLVFLIILGLLVFVHEIGHFLVAKRAGIEVEEFALGFGPKIYSRLWQGTLYRVNLVPWGGYVKMAEESEKKLSLPAQFLVALAGVVGNFLFAVLLLWLGYLLTMPPLTLDPEKLVGKKTNQAILVGVLKDSAAEKAGLKPGDIIAGFSNAQELSEFTKSHSGETIHFQIKRGKNELVKEITLSRSEPPLGVEAAQFTMVKLGFGHAFLAAWQDAWGLTKLIAKFAVNFFKDIVVAGKVAEEAAGPVGIFQYLEAAIKAGWIYVLQLTVLLSVNFAVFNFLPLPALDGGHLLFLTLRGIFGRRLIKREVENFIHSVGFALLILLMIFITYRDIIRLR